MSVDDEQDGKARSAKEVDRREASLLLSGLVLTPDSSLGMFRERRAADSTLDIDHLRRARDILDQVSLAITSSEQERWDRVERAWRVLCEPEAADETDAAAADREKPSSTEQQPAAPDGDAAADDTASAQAATEPADEDMPPKPALLGTEPATSSPPTDEARPPPVQDARRSPRPPLPVSPPPPPVQKPPPPPAPAPPAPPLPVTASGAPAGAAPPAPAMVPGTGPAEPSGVSPWAAAASSASQPTAEESDALAATAETKPADVAGIDVEALNRVKLDENEPATLSVDDSALADTALPFRKAAAKPPPSAASEVKQEEGASLGETMEVGMMSPLAKMTLPFQKESEPSAPPAAPSSEEASGDDAGSSGPPSGRASDDDAVRAAAQDPAPPPDRGSSPQPAATGMLGTSTPTSEPTNVTEALPSPRDAAEAGGGTLPEPPDHLRRMTVEQYAALCAESAVHPDFVNQIHIRYHILSSEQRASLDAHWRVRMAADAQLTQHFRWHYARYEQWAKQQKR